MRTDKEIEAEITKLQSIGQMPGRWNAATMEIISEQINALSNRSTHAQVELGLCEDETTEEFTSNDLWQAVDEAVSWMNGENGYKAPSEEML